jgi:hypothetical protein
MSGSLFIQSKIASYTLLLPVEYWYYPILFSAAATAIALIVIVATRPSRLERFIAGKLSRRVAYRTAGYLALAIGLVFVCAKLYQYCLYRRTPAP